MKVYVEAYDADDNQILGNLDGQLSWTGQQYKRTGWYKNLKWRYASPRVVYYKIVTDAGKLLEKVIRQMP